MSQDLMPLEQALSRLLSAAPVISEREKIPLAAALKRVIAEACHARGPVPPHDNSAVDGYALRTADLGPNPLPISQRIAAGQAPEPLAPGSVARIFTGACIPAGADAVVMQENTQVADGHMSVQPVAMPGQNIRPAGQDLQAGVEALAAGTRLRAPELGLLASIGLAEVNVFRRLKVAILTTGDELVMPGRLLAPGQIYNTNHFTLQGLLQGLQLEIVDCGDVADTLEATEQALRLAATQADVIITTGGVSVGEEDHVRSAIGNLGQLDLWRLAMKPGKPLAFGRIDTTPVPTPILGLPGNPAAVLVTFMTLARPFLLKMQGLKAPLTPAPLTLPAYFTVARAGLRREFMRVRCHLNATGQSYLEAHPNQSSGMLSSAAWASGLAVIEEGRTVQFGDLVPYLPFSDLLE